MSVVRIKKAHKKPYVLLDTTALNDTHLSFRAKGLHTYLMAKPDDWQVYLDQLEKMSPNEGRDAIRIAMKELESAGYVKRQKIRGERGRLAGWDTTVFETTTLAAMESDEREDAENIGLSASPTTDLPKSVPPKSVPPKSVPPKSAIPQLLSIDLNQGLNLERIEKTSPHNPPMGDGFCVMTPEVEKLIAEVKAEAKAARTGKLPNAVSASGDILHREPQATGGGKASAKKPLRPPSSKRCPPGHMFDASIRAWALDRYPDVDVDEAIEAMRDWEFKTARSDWDATLRTWIRTEAKRRDPGRPPRASPEEDTRISAKGRRSVQAAKRIIDEVIHGTDRYPALPRGT